MKGAGPSPQSEVCSHRYYCERRRLSMFAVVHSEPRMPIGCHLREWFRFPAFRCLSDEAPSDVEGQARRCLAIGLKLQTYDD